MKRIRKVERPVGGAGTCLSDISNERFEAGECNIEACPDDGICESEDDLIIFINPYTDTKQKWDDMKALVSATIDRYNVGENNIRIAVISGQILIHSLSGNLNKLKEAVDGMVMQYIHTKNDDVEKVYSPGADIRFLLEWYAGVILDNLGRKTGTSTSSVLIFTDDNIYSKFGIEAACNKIKITKDVRVDIVLLAGENVESGIVQLLDNCTSDGILVQPVQNWVQNGKNDDAMTMPARHIMYNQCSHINSV